MQFSLLNSHCQSTAIVKMLFSKPKSNSSRYVPVGQHNDDEDSITTSEKHSLPELYYSSSATPLLKLTLCCSVTLTLLLGVAVVFLSASLSRYQACSSISELRYGHETRLDTTSHLYSSQWPDRIARVSRKLKNAVWGQGTQVYITVEDSTIMRFPVPENGARTCALSWVPPPDGSPREKDLTTKGDITEIEVWQLIAASVTTTTASSGMDELDYNSLSYSELPVRGELLGVLDLTTRPNSTTVEFACPRDPETLTVELMCQRVACHVSFMQADSIEPSFGFRLARRKE